LLYIDEDDQHFPRAQPAGATILSEVEGSSPGRLYRVADLEGHRWIFMQRQK
jgi:PhnB protein